MIELSYRELKELCTHFSRVIPRSSKLPVLQNVMFHLCSGGLNLQVTNLDEWLVYRTDSQESDTSVVNSFQLSFSHLKRIASAMKRGDSIRLEPRSGELKVTYTGQSALSLTYPILPAADFPVYQSGGERVTLNLGYFMEAYRCCTLTASSDPDKLVMNSVFFDSRERQLVSTDGRRLLHLDCALELKRDMILPITKTLKSAKLFSGDADLIATDERFELQCGKWIYQCKQLEGNYPNWRQVVTTPGEYEIKLPGGESIIQFIDQLALEKGKQSSLALRPFNNELYLLIADSGVLRSALVREAECTANLPEVCLDAAFFKDAMKICTKEPVLFIAGSHSPVTVRSADQRECIIMPQRGADSEKITEHLQQHYGKSLKQNQKTKPEEKEVKKEELSVVDTGNPLDEIYEAIESLAESQAEARGKADEVAKIIRDCQLGLKAVNRMIKAYEKSSARKQKEYQQMQQLIGKLKLAAA